MAVCLVHRHLHRAARECAWCPVGHTEPPAIGRRPTDAVEAPGVPARSPPQPPSQPGGTRLGDLMPPFKPCIEEILMAQAPTLRHVPAAVRVDLAATLGAILHELAEAPTWEGVYRYVALPKLVLRELPRGGKSHHGQAAEVVRRRLGLFREGRYEALWDAPDERRKPRTRGQAKVGEFELSKASVDTIRGLVEEGALSKAAKHLVSRGLHDSSDPAVCTALQELHPVGHDPPLGAGNEIP